MKLTVENLGCRRGEFRVLKNVGFEIKAGQALILRGPNGSGKTTLLRTLAGLIPPEEGRISAPEDSLIYAGHDDGIKSQLGVAENLTFWAEVFGSANAARKVSGAMETFSLTSLANRAAQHLSAGQKRRLGLARLLVTDRPIWLLDEPTISLDRANVEMFAQMVDQHLSNSGLAIIATHIDLGLKSGRDLDISVFKASTPDAANPFLEGGFA